MKDEVKGKVIGKFVELKSKMCSLVSVNNEKNNQIKLHRIGNYDLWKFLCLVLMIESIFSVLVLTV